MSEYLPHEKLNAYIEALACVKLMQPVVEQWPRRYSVRDQMIRAYESILVNLANAERLRHTDRGVFLLECSLGSVLECAACLDIAFVKGLIKPPEVQAGKAALQRIARMQVGLRKAWVTAVHEAQESYGAEGGGSFLHESLDVYQQSLRLCRMLETEGGEANKRQGRYARRIDEMITSLVLNIAEGNGRFSMSDHRKFIGLAQNAVTSLSVYLDLNAMRHPVEIEPARRLLARIDTMLASLGGYLESRSIE